MRSELVVRLPADAHGLSQDKEYCFLVENGQERKIRLHDYVEIYKVPGLYEHIIANLLQCTSPTIIASMLAEEVTTAHSSISDLVVLELGAGNGMVGEALHQKGVGAVIGIDIIEEAAAAAYRDRPHVYQKYYVENVCNMTPQSRAELESASLNCLVCASAMGSGLPPDGFVHVYNLIAQNGWIVFNIKEGTIEERPSDGLPLLIHRIIEHGILDVIVARHYQHRLAIDGQPITYVTIVGRKHTNIPQELISE